MNSSLRPPIRLSMTGLATGLAIMLAAGTAWAGGDAANGRLVFKRCAICHSDAKGAPNKIGPNLFGIVGRKAASAANFYYSSAMKKSGIVWTPARLAAYIAHPQKVVPGNRMPFAGISNEKQIADLVAYLKTLK